MNENGIGFVEKNKNFLIFLQLFPETGEVTDSACMADSGVKAARKKVLCKVPGRAFAGRSKSPLRDGEGFEG